MAENDTRVDNLEDEVKILKGEVRRTLVDLRALLMREDSPLNEGSLGRRSSQVDWDPNDASPQSHMAVTETRQFQGEPSGPGFPNQPVREPVAAAPSPPHPAYPDQGFGPGFMTPPQMGPQPGAGWPAPQPHQPPPPPTPQGSSDLESAMAERERRMAEQEQRMAEQERRISDQERLADQERKISDQGRLADQERRISDQERLADQERRISDQERKVANAESTQRRQDRNLPDEGIQRDQPSPNIQITSNMPERESPSTGVDVEVEDIEQPEQRKRPAGRTQTQELEDISAQEPPRPARPAGGGAMRETEDYEVNPVLASRSLRQDQWEDSDDDDWEEPVRRRFTTSAPRPGGELTFYYDDDEETDGPPPRLQRREKNWAAAQDSDRPSGRPVNPTARRRQVRSQNEIDPHENDNGNRPLKRNGAGSRVYDEYNQLLSETEASYLETGEANPAAPMDINLVASLVRWASIAKQRVGDDRLRNILDLYLQSGHATPGLREVLTQITGMADSMAHETNQSAQESVDLIYHLHGILTGDLSVVRVPQMKIAA